MDDLTDDDVELALDVLPTDPGIGADELREEAETAIMTGRLRAWWSVSGQPMTTIDDLV